VDDASPAVQFAREQTYLAFKTLAAFRACAEMAKASKDARFAQICRKRMRLINKALAGVWMGDHYPVCMVRSARGLKNPWTGKPLSEAQIEGFDAYTLYTGNGLLYLLMTGTDVECDEEKLRTDVVSTRAASLSEYGCTHSSVDTANLWVSQNLWRDFVAAYLGLDMLDMIDRYWAHQVFENTSGREGGFTDTYGANWLSFYPRGAAAFGIFPAGLGLRFDRTKRRITLAPVRAPMRMPILQLADWKRGRIPWVEVSLTNGRMNVRLENPSLLGGYKVRKRK
jgi:hypothetical protein